MKTKTTAKARAPHKPCGKNRYATEREAIRNAIAANRKSGQPLRVYRCPDCKGWHLTKQKNRRSKPSAASPLRARNANGRYVGFGCGQYAWIGGHTSAANGSLLSGWTA